MDVELRLINTAINRIPNVHLQKFEKPRHFAETSITPLLPSAWLFFVNGPWENSLSEVLGLIQAPKIVERLLSSYLVRLRPWREHLKFEWYSKKYWKRRKNYTNKVMLLELKSSNLAWMLFWILFVIRKNRSLHPEKEKEKSFLWEAYKRG